MLGASRHRKNAVGGEIDTAFLRRGNTFADYTSLALRLPLAMWRIRNEQRT